MNNDGVRSQQFSSITSGILTGGLSVILALCTVALLILIYLDALSGLWHIPDIGAVSSEWLLSLFSTWYVGLIGVALIAVPLLLIILVNVNRFRRVLLGVGISMLSVALVIMIFALLDEWLLGSFSADWQDVLVNTSAVLDSYCMLGAIVLVVIGAGCLSAYACIAAIKGAKR